VHGADSAGPAVVASVVVTNEASGQRFRLATDADGRFTVENVPPGGPYTIEVHAPGYAPARAEGIVLALGQRYRFVVPLAPAAVQLGEVTVRATADPILHEGRTGPAHIVSDSAARRLPLLTRDFVSLLQTAPEVSGTSVAGVNNRYNSILIDGGADNDFFGLSRGTGAPGGQVAVRSLPLDAVQEFDVIVAPFDVRQGNFQGGQINAVTRSGGNTVHGSLFGFYQNQALVGHDTTGAAVSKFATYQYGASLGGPIVRDRVHVFVSGELNHRAAPFTGPTIAPGSAVGISLDSVTRFVNLLQGYGLDPGSFGAYTTEDLGGNLFAKLSASTGGAGLLETSLNYAHGEIADTLAPPRTVGGDYRLTSAGFAPTSNQWSTRVRWTTVAGGRVSNELIGAYLHVDEPRTPAVIAPAVFVSNVGDPGFAGARLIAGSDPGSQRLALTQRSFELTDNATVGFGAHLVTVGAHAELLQFDFASFATSIGQYQFLNLDSLAAGRPFRFTRNIALRPGGPVANFGANEYAVYAQDQWRVTGRLVLTGGLRLDLPTFPDRPVTNDSLERSPFAINTEDFVQTTVLWSPRVGFNWTPRAGTELRGGAGLFTGRVPYTWLSFAFSNTGNDAALITCNGAAAPNFVPDAAKQPSACVGATSKPLSAITYFDRNFQLPQTVKLALGADQRLPWGIVGSIDGLYQIGLHELYIVDDNLKGPVGALAGEAGRVMYGTIAASSANGALPAVTPSKVSSGFGPILRNTSRNGDRSFTLTVQGQKRFSSGIEFATSYSYTYAQDRLSLRDAQTVSNYGFVPLEGTLADRTLGTSVFATPHKVTVSGTANLPYGLAASLIYVGQSGLPYTYVVNGDANADGVGNLVAPFDRQQSDPIYVPRGPTDISLVRDSTTTGSSTALVADPAAAAALEGFIARQDCLDQSRGEILPRNRCRNPWQNLLNARVAKDIGLTGAHTLQLTLDVFNLLHLLSGNWGLVRQTGSFAGAGTENVPLLKLRGQNAALGRNLYQLTLPARDAINVDASRWRLQLGARYAF
jgi:Carboxypeptidase regulatory-like domain/TonB dependent receptor